MKRSVDAKELKEIASIIEIISKYVQLKKTGRTYKGLSPFTNEKTPSLIVNPEGQFFKDFSSGKGGDVFTFLMEYHRYSFKEALEEVAEYYGYSITNTFNKKKSGGKSVKERLINLNNIAQQEYRRQFKETASGEIARQYIKKRSISSDMVDMFGIGYVPDEWNTITDLFIKANIPKEDLEKTDLVIKSRKNNKYYDRFRFRLMFPIYDENDKLIGFGGRTLGKGKSTGTDPAKYLNSSDSELFNKSSLLYNLNLAKNEIREMETVIITEGYLDVIACYQNGIRNVVAPMGTALTPNQLKKLERYAKKIILMFDGDRAGINAAVKSIDIIFQTNLETSVVILPEAQDPYDYLLKYGKDELKFLLNNAQDGLDFKLNNIAKNYDLKTAKGKENFINQSFYFLNSTKNRIIIEVGLKKIAGIVKLPEDTIREYFKESK
ncbi:MAG: DNA primase, partial [Spirochaetota bacterium]